MSTMELESSSPVAHVPLVTNGQWVAIVGHAFDGGYFVVGPFKTEEEADQWRDDNGSKGSIVACLDPEKTIVDRCQFPLHLDDAYRS